MEETSKADNIAALDSRTRAVSRRQRRRVRRHARRQSNGLRSLPPQDPSTGDVTIVANGTTTVYQNVSADLYRQLQGTRRRQRHDARGRAATICRRRRNDLRRQRRRQRHDLRRRRGGQQHDLRGAADTIYAGDGGDTITGGSGNDEIYGGAGYDTPHGGHGAEQLDPGRQRATALITGGSGNDWLYGGSGTTTINGGSGTEVIHGGSGTNYLNGGSGLDDIYGGSGTNFIYGNGEHDILEGGSGKNFIQPNYQGHGHLPSIQVKDRNGTPIFDGNIDAYGHPYSDANDYAAVDPAYAPPSLAGSGPSTTRLRGRVWAGHVNPHGCLRQLAARAAPITTAADGYQGTHWATDAEYEIFDWRHARAAACRRDQQTQPGNDSPVPNDRAVDAVGRMGYFGHSHRRACGCRFAHRLGAARAR